MSAKLRAAIAKQIIDVVHHKQCTNINQLATVFELGKNSQIPELHLPLSKAKHLFPTDTQSLVKDILNTKFDDRLVKAVTAVEKSSSQKLVFTLQDTAFVQSTLRDHKRTISPEQCDPKRYIVEFSSPNIAKPFHVGHLRSTIIGNFIANLYEFLGNDVCRMNYLGDWGTQFGLLNVGIELMNLSDNDIRQNPIENLYNAYVEANRKSQTDSSIGERARKYFYDLENNLSPENQSRWEKYRQYTIDELRSVYQRLGVQFDEYEWESQYSQKDIQRILQRLEDGNLLLDESDGPKVVQIGDRRVPIIKSDGSTLYLARDIAAIVNRFDRYKFDRIIYVVDNAQTDHFVALFDTAAKTERLLDGRMQHVKFGRIRGMSTRQGTVVFLKDVLEEAKDIMRTKQLNSPTTKIDMNSHCDNHVSDILGVSAVIINDLKQRRQRDYEFDWDRALQANGDTGIKLQYTHCRLKSLFENNPLRVAVEAMPELLREPEATALIIELARFPEVLLRCEEQLEACILVNYLFGLSNAISRGLKRLNIKNEKSSQLQEQRLLLFSQAHKVLHDGMKILGLKPLDKM